MDTLKKSRKDVFETMEAIQYDPYSESEEESRFKAPSNSEALKIWRQCGCLEEENESFICNGLFIWAEDNKLLYTLNNESSELYITWISDTNVTYKFKWVTFLKWFSLACQRV